MDVKCPQLKSLGFKTKDIIVRTKFEQRKVFGSGGKKREGRKEYVRDSSNTCLKFQKSELNFKNLSAL